MFPIYVQDNYKLFFMFPRYEQDDDKNILHVHICELIDSYRILYPFEKTFSHTPFNKQANDKSRIDLFLCSNNFHENVHDIQYLCPTSKAFDHCPLKVSIGKKKKAYK